MKRPLLGLALALTLSTACAEQDCTAIYIPAMSVEVVDDQGDPIEDASVIFAHEDGEEAGECLGDGASGRSCGSQAGEYTVTAQAPGYGESSLMVTVEADGCDLLTEDVELVLSPSP